MKKLIFVTSLLLVSTSLGGCLATMATVGASIATGIAAGCDSAERTKGANKQTVSDVCGSFLK
jgi:predicted small secreted protein